LIYRIGSSIWRHDREILGYRETARRRGALLEWGRRFRLPLEFLHFSGISSADQGLIGDLETEWSE